MELNEDGERPVSQVSRNCIETGDPIMALNCLYNALFNGYALNPLSPHGA